jgi:hypothetical protein
MNLTREKKTQNDNICNVLAILSKTIFTASIDKVFAIKNIILIFLKIPPDFFSFIYEMAVFRLVI